jgi:hypothetical protein
MAPNTGLWRHEEFIWEKIAAKAEEPGAKGIRLAPVSSEDKAGMQQTLVVSSITLHRFCSHSIL